jgi:release factor glutamine methyltransferase
VGRWGFRNLDLMVDQRVLIPRPETEEVAGLAIEHARRLASVGIAPTVVDLGTGSGAIGLSIATEVPEALVHLTDASADAVAVARANLTGIGTSATRVSIWQGSWFDALPRSLAGALHVVVSNPPYVRDDDDLSPTVAAWEPTEALRSGPEGLDDLYEIVVSAATWLTAQGALVLEMAPDQTTVVTRWCAENGLGHAEVRRDLSGRPRAIVARRTAA